MRPERLAAPLIFLLALVPRALSGPFLTIDEGYHWFDRARVFTQAVAARDYAATNLIGHPGVTTLWLGAIGTWLEQALASAALIPTGDSDLHRALVRLPLAIVASLCIVGALPLLRRLLGQRTALVAGLLWAGEPFLVAHGQLLHLDSLLTSWMMLSLLALLVAVSENQEPTQDKETRRQGDKETEVSTIDDQPPATSYQLPASYRPSSITQDDTSHKPQATSHRSSSIVYHPLIVSAVFAGLATLTKSPSVLLIPLTGLLLLIAARRAGAQTFGALVRRTAVPMLLWLAVAAAVWVALWPAAWVDLPGAVNRVITQAEADGGSPHGWGNFFLGQPVSDPGPLFYPVAVALRLAPWTLLGVAALGIRALLALRRNGKRWLRDYSGAAEGFTLLALGGFVMLFLLMMSIPPKKFDRYALPIFPVLDILGAAGMVWAVGLLGQRDRRTAESIAEQKNKRTKGPIEDPGPNTQDPIINDLQRSATIRTMDEQPPATSHQPPATSHQPSFLPLAFLTLALVLAANLLWYHPYELAYFNPLLGGGPAAARLIPVGWGEGYEQAGAYVAAQPDGADRPVAAFYEPVLAPFAPDGAAPMDWAYEPGRVDYAVLYIDQIQRGYKPWLVEGLLGKVNPVHTVTIHGIEYAYIYQIAPPVGHPLAADFGDAIRLRGYDLDTSQVRSSGAITVTLVWEGLDVPNTDLTMFVHVLGADGTRIGQVDVPPGGDRWPTSQWGRGRYITSVQRVPVVADAPPGEYHLAIGLYNQQGFVRLPLRAAPGSPDPGAGPDALQLASFTMP